MWRMGVEGDLVSQRFTGYTVYLDVIRTDHAAKVFWGLILILQYVFFLSIASFSTLICFVLEFSIMKLCICPPLCGSVFKDLIAEMHLLCSGSSLLSLPLLPEL